MRVDGLRQGSVPVIDDAVDLGLDQQLRPLAGLQLREEKLTFAFIRTSRSQKKYRALEADEQLKRDVSGAAVPQ